MNISHIDFYFDYLSPYAFFGWLNIQTICEKRNLRLEIHPILFAGLLDHWGQLGPAEIPPKRLLTAKHTFRYAALRGINLNPPAAHPFNPLTALRLSLKEVSGDQQHKVINAIFHAGWTEGKDIGSPDVLRKILNQAAIDADSLFFKITAETKEILKRETETAIKRNVFGIPTFIINDDVLGEELFWGNDQIEYIELFLDGKDPLNRDKVNSYSARPRAADRPKFLSSKARN